MAYRFILADVFTQTPFAGNQLAVFPEAQGLSDRAMQAIAREFNFSETTFVLPPQDPHHHCNVRIFTPSTEVDFAGHPTVGTAAVLAHLGLLDLRDGVARVVLEEKAGPVTVEVRYGGAAIVARFSVAREVVTSPPLPRAMVAKVLSLSEDAVLETWFASLGLPFCFAHLADRLVVDQAMIDHGAWAKHLSKTWAPFVFLFAGDLQPGSRLYARMFAPSAGVDEDPATGSAAAALTAILAGRSAVRDGILAWTIDQGVAMGRPSVIEAAAEQRAGRTTAVLVGGATVIMGEGSMVLPADW